MKGLEQVRLFPNRGNGSLVVAGSRPSRLTVLEYRHINYLHHRNGEIVPASEVIEHVDANNSGFEVNALDGIVARVRRKLGTYVI